MSQSRFCLKSYGVIELNNQTLNTNTTGTLFVNDINVDINRVVGYTGGSGSGLSFTSFNNEPEHNLGGQFVVLNDSTGNVVTNTFGLSALTHKGSVTGIQSPNGNNSINLRPIGGLEINSNSDRIQLSSPEIHLISNNFCNLNTSELNINTPNLIYNVARILSSGTITRLQTGTITTGVACENPFGHILTVEATTGTQSSSTFNVVCGIVSVNSLIQISINSYTGNQGLPNTYVSNITTGNFNVNISNYSITVPLNGQLKLAYSIMN